MLLLLELAGEAVRGVDHLLAEVVGEVVEVGDDALVKGGGPLVGCHLVELGGGDQARNFGHRPRLTAGCDAFAQAPPRWVSCSGRRGCGRRARRPTPRTANVRGPALGCCWCAP